MTRLTDLPPDQAKRLAEVEKHVSPDVSIRGEQKESSPAVTLRRREIVGRAPCWPSTIPSRQLLGGRKTRCERSDRRVPPSDLGYWLRLL